MTIKSWDRFDLASNIAAADSCPRSVFQNLLVCLAGPLAAPGLLAPTRFQLLSNMRIRIRRAGSEGSRQTSVDAARI